MDVKKVILLDTQMALTVFLRNTQTVISKLKFISKKLFPLVPV